MMRHRRPWILYAVLVLFLGTAAGVLWLTYHPESPHWKRIVRWPVLGTWAQQLREVYLPQEDRPAARPEAPPPSVIRKGLSPEEEAELRARREAAWEAARDEATAAQIERIRAREFRWFRAGVTVREAPDVGAPGRLTLEAPQRFSFLERQGDWARVRLGGLDGWIPVTVETLLAEPPLGRDPAPVVPVPGLTADPRLLDLAHRRLGEAREGRLGGYPLLTDVADAVFLRDLDGTARGVAKAYVRRYGLTIRHPPAATVILFRREADYRAFQAEETQLVGLKPRGHTGHGVAALYRGTQTDAEVSATLAHELVHLINRRALGPALPPWLNEGMAEDVSLSFRHPDGRIDFSRLAGARQRTGTSTYRLRLGHASLERLRRARTMGKLKSVEQLVRMDWETFVTPDDQEVHYAFSAFWIRHLMEEPKLAPRFRAYLSRVAGGTPLTPTTLEGALKRDWTALEAGFEASLESPP